MSFVAEHRDRFGVEPILRVLEIPVSTFYGWGAQQRDPCQHQRQDAWLVGKIRAIHKRSRGTYGAPRVHAQLRRDGVQVSRKRVARLMGAHGLQGAFLRKRWRCSTRQDPKATPAPDLVNRDFTAPAPNRLWVADISRIPTGEGPLWLASVRDAFSRRIVGWKTSDRADTDLVLGALEYAVWGRGLDGTLGQPRLVHHSDRGAQGGFNWSSQHLNHEGVVLWRDRSRVRPIGRCVLRCGHLGGPRSTGGRSSSASGTRSPRAVKRGRRHRLWRVYAGGRAVVPPSWRHVTNHPYPTVGALSVVCRARGDRAVAGAAVRGA
jgi:putative transposase